MSLVEQYEQALLRRERLVPLVVTAEAALEDAMDALGDVSIVHEREPLRRALREAQRARSTAEAGIREASNRLAALRRGK